MKQSVIEKIEKSDFYREIIRKEETELLDKRKAAAEAMSAVDKDTADQAKGIVKTLQEAQKVCAECEKAHQDALARVNQLRTERFGIGTRAEAAKNQHMAFLAETSDSKIDEAIAWFKSRFDDLRGGTAIQQRHLGKFDLAHMERQITTVSNQKTREAALGYCRRAIETLEAMRLVPELDNEKLQRLAAEMPDPTNFFDEVQGRKVERDVAHLPPWARIKSDSLHDLEMDHLMKKTNSVLRKRA